MRWRRLWAYADTGKEKLTDLRTRKIVRYFFLNGSNSTRSLMITTLQVASNPHLSRICPFVSYPYTYQRFFQYHYHLTWLRSMSWCLFWSTHFLNRKLNRLDFHTLPCMHCTQLSWRTIVSSVYCSFLSICNSCGLDPCSERYYTISLTIAQRLK